MFGNSLPLRHLISRQHFKFHLAFLGACLFGDASSPSDVFSIRVGCASVRASRISGTQSRWVHDLASPSREMFHYLSGVKNVRKAIDANLKNLTLHLNARFVAGSLTIVSASDDKTIAVCELENRTHHYGPGRAQRLSAKCCSQ